MVLNYLYKHTSMQETFGANMLALVNGEPKVLSLREMLYHYIAHQKDVVTRRTKYDQMCIRDRRLPQAAQRKRKQRDILVVKMPVGKKWRSEKQADRSQQRPAP